uniref:UDP-glucuronate decarboxylase n=1 Tax=Ditylum brightwellii TaxID=49249 RepID=A0A6U3PUF8_9STRA|mmetsp:Transcript_16269/g.24112  ORF Transcript_16269/g.24112 Transcript_16269/m.24112 type:complete len:504 (+) Transcript_16269:101-1612(+)
MVRITNHSRRLPQRRNGTSTRGNSTMGFRQTFMVLSAGMLIGYMVLPVLLVQNVTFNDLLEERVLLAPSSNKPFLSEKDETVGEATNLRSPPRSSSGVDIPKTFPDHENSRMMAKKGHPVLSTSFATEFRGREKHVLSELSDTEKSILESQTFLSSYSIPTATTPYVMHTPRLPDRDRKKVLVTGGAGFVGSHLVDKLMMEGHEVIVIDNFFTGQKKNVEHWMHHPHFSIKTHDVTEPIMLEVDQIYHLACPASPPHYQYNPVKTIKTSTMGTINMLGLAKRVKARMLLTSTSEIYGDPQVHPQPESYWGNVNTIGPRACYDEGKRVAETMMYSYKNQNHVEVRVARIFNTFGPRMHPNDGRVVSNFIIQALQDKDLTIYGEGLQTRSFQYVDDLVEGLFLLMNGDYDMPVNLGNPDEYTVKDFAEYIQDLTMSNSEIKFLEKTEDDPKQRKPDITVAKDNIDWAPKVKVKDGLKKTIDYFQRVLDADGEIIPTGPNGAKPQA